MHMHKSLQFYKSELGIHPTRSLEAVSHLALRPKLFKIIVKQRVLSYEASTDPPVDSQGRQIDTRVYDTPCPECGKMFTASGMKRHMQLVHPEAVPSASINKTPAGVSVAYPTLNNPVAPRYNQAESWKKVTSKSCPSCARIFPTISQCRQHWSQTCSHPLAKKCRGCQLLIKAAAKASFKAKGHFVYESTRPSRALNERAWKLHTCLADPEKAPPNAYKQWLSRGKPAINKPARPQPPSAPLVVPPAAPRPLHYQLLPRHTVRKFKRPPIRMVRGKRHLFASPFRQLRPEEYKPLPDGWEWPPLPIYSDLPYQKPKKRRKKRIPQEVLDEWRLWSRPKTPKANESPEGPDAAMDTSNVAARNPLTGELDSGRVSDSDSLEGEVWGADMNPFDGEAWAGLDDPD